MQFSQPSSNPPATMRELGLLLGFSTSTVSLALRNDPRVAESTRRLVNDAARKAGYQLNPALTHLMSKVRRTQRAQYRETLAWLNLGDSADRFSSDRLEYLHHLWLGAKTRAETLGYVLEDFWMGDSEMTARRMSQILTSRGIRGVLIPPLARSAGHVSLNCERFSSIALSYTILRPELHRVVTNHHLNMQILLRKIVRRGYRRPGLLLSQGFDKRTDQHYSAGFYHHQQSLPTRARIPLLTIPLAGDEPRCRRWLKRFRPDVVITVGGLRHLRELDIGDADYSEKLGVVLLGFAKTDEGFCAINENPLQIGATGIDELIASLNRNERGLPQWPRTTQIPGFWVEGKTLPMVSPA